MLCYGSLLKGIKLKENDQNNFWNYHTIKIRAQWIIHFPVISPYILIFSRISRKTYNIFF